MVDQAEIHRDVVSVYAETRREVASQLRDNFVILPDKEQAWNDLHRLTYDRDRYVRLRAADALGYAFPHVPDREQAFNDLHRLTGDKDVDVRLHAADAIGSAFPHIHDKGQAWNDLHRLTEDGYHNVRLHAADALGYAFPHVLDREQAWNDLHSLTYDNDRYVRLRVADALGYAFPHALDREQAWNDLHSLTEDEDRDVRSHAAYALGYAFPHVPDREQAWNDLHSLTEDEDRDVRLRAIIALGYAFPHVPNRKRSWNDLYRLTEGEDHDVRLRAIIALGYAFPHVPDREQAWNDLHSLIEDEDRDVRLRAIIALGYAFPHVPDREQAWNDLHSLTEDEDQYVRSHAAYSLGHAFPHVPDREQAWNDLHSLTEDEDPNVRSHAAYALGHAFPHVTDKIQAWNDLHRLAKDEYQNVRFRAAVALGYAFPHIPDREQAWNDLHSLTEDEDRDVRLRAIIVLGYAFPHVPDREQAWNDLHSLTEDEDQYVRSHAAYSLGYAFPHVPDREQAWNDLRRLTEDEDRDARVSANHSLGRASIFKATETKSEEKFRKEIKNALKFFERSSNETSHFTPSKFCLPFYRSFHAITFEGAGADEVQKYFIDAKSASKGSESKETLLEAVDNLANSLAKVHKAREANLDTIQSDLNECRQCYDHFADLVGIMEDKAPSAARVLRRGGLIIDDQIKEILREIHEKSKALYSQTKDTPLEDSGKEICRISQSLSQIRYQTELEKGSDILQFALSDICGRLPEEARRGTCELSKRLNESYGEDKIAWMSAFLSRITPYIGMVKEMTKIEITNCNIGGVGKTVHVDMNLLANQKEKSDPIPESHTEPTTVPFLLDLEYVLCDIFKSVYQKERKEGVSEVNSKTLEFLKYKLLDLTASGKEINWLDVGCGDGRCLHVLDAVQNIGNIRYHGTDSSYRYLDDTEARARKYKLDARLDKIDASAMKFDSEYDVVSAVLLLHEVDPLCLPHILRNMLRALKGDGTLIISDFQGPYEQEKGVVAWGAEDIRNLLESIGGAKMSIEFISSSQYPDELGFYRCYVKKPGLDQEKFSDLLHGYGNFMDAKKEESKRKRGELRSQIEERVRKLLNRLDIDLKNISKGEMRRIQTEIGDEYGIKAHKIRLLTSQIEFLDDKIKEFRSGVGCDGADQRAP